MHFYIFNHLNPATKMSNFVKNVKGWTGFTPRKDSVPELSRSQYSLVSCGEITPAALTLWMELPEEVKNDPHMASFRKFFEQEHGLENPSHTARLTKNGCAKRLPLVSSAPHLNNNLNTLVEEKSLKNDSKRDIEVTVKKDFVENVICRQRRSKLARAGYYIKISILLACWIFFTLMFLMYGEKEEIVWQSSIEPGGIKDYPINSSLPNLSVNLKLTGPFLTEHSEEKYNETDKANAAILKVWLERWTTNDSAASGSHFEISNVESTEPWTIILAPQKDFSKGLIRDKVLRFHTNETSPKLFTIRMKSTTNKTVPITMSYTVDPLDPTTGVIYSCVLLCGLYILIIFEVINRTMAAVVVATTSLAVLAMVGERPTLPEIISWMDVETLLLLFSMMLLVAILTETGLFDYLAVYTFQVTKGNMWALINSLCGITAIVSLLLDNVTTVMLMTPITIRLCEVMELDPVPILMSMVLYCNVGGTATAVGDPPNVIISSNKEVIASGINFTNFTLHMTIGVILVWIQTYLQLKFIYRDTDKLRSKVPKEIQEVRQQISIWRRAADSLPNLSKDQLVVKERLERKIKKLNILLAEKIKESTKRACPKDTFQSTLDEMKEKYRIRDKWLLVKSTFALIFVVVMFFLHSLPEMNRVSLGWTALLGAVLLLILADREDLEPILHRVEWSTLLFFAALFVLMEALSKLGLIDCIGGYTEALIMSVDESSRLAVALILMLWVSGLTSAFVDNVPLASMMVRVVTSLGSNPNLNLPMAPLIWALSYGVCLGGNGTLIGASANVVCAGVAEQHGYKFSFMQFFRVGFPVMVGHLIVASAYLLLCHCVFTWH